LYRRSVPSISSGPADSPTSLDDPVIIATLITATGQDRQRLLWISDVPSKMVEIRAPGQSHRHTQ
jgi:hypothetical protein